MIIHKRRFWVKIRNDERKWSIDSSNDHWWWLSSKQILQCDQVLTWIFVWFEQVWWYMPRIAAIFVNWICVLHPVWLLVRICQPQWPRSINNAKAWRKWMTVLEITHGVVPQNRCENFSVQSPHKVMCNHGIRISVKRKTQKNDNNISNTQHVWTRRKKKPEPACVIWP